MNYTIKPLTPALFAPNLLGDCRIRRIQKCSISFDGEVDKRAGPGGRASETRPTIAGRNDDVGKLCRDLGGWGTCVENHTLTARSSGQSHDLAFFTISTISQNFLQNRCLYNVSPKKMSLQKSYLYKKDVFPKTTCFEKNVLLS